MRRRTLAVVFFALLLGVSVLTVGCANSGNPISPSTSPPVTTPQPVAKTKLSIANVIPSAPSGTTFTYGDSVSVDVSWEMTAEDWASSPAPTIFVCVAQDQNTTLADGCRGKVLQSSKGAMQGIPATVPNRVPSNTVSQTNYIQVFLTRDWNLAPYQEYLDVQNTLFFPFSRLAPVLVGDPTPVARTINWTPPAK